MSLFPAEAVGRRNRLLQIAAISLGLAFITGPGTFFALGSLAGMVAAVLMAAGGYFAAKGIRELADLPLRSRYFPWYGRCGAIPFLIVMLTLVNGLFLIFDSVVTEHFPAARLSTQLSRLFVAIAMELFWIVLLDWPDQTTEPKVDTRIGPDGPILKPYRDGLMSGSSTVLDTETDRRDLCTARRSSEEAAERW